MRKIINRVIHGGNLVYENLELGIIRINLENE